MKLRILCKKIKADFLQGTCQVIGVAMNSNPMTMTYSHVILSFQTKVHNKFPPTMTASQRSRRMAELNKNRDDNQGGGRGRGRGRWHGRGQGRGRGCGRGRGGRGYPNNKRSHPQARTITAVDGSSMSIHPSYSFSADEWARIPHHEKDILRRERTEYKRRNDGGSSVISEVTQAVLAELRQGASLPPPPEDNPVPQPSSVVPRTIMGGRNEQASRRGHT